MTKKPVNNIQHNHSTTYKRGKSSVRSQESRSATASAVASASPGVSDDTSSQSLTDRSACAHTTCCTFDHTPPQ